MLKLLRRMKSKDFFMVLISAVLIVAQVFLDLKLPDYMSEMTMLINTEGELSSIWAAGLKMLACALGSFAMMIFTVFFSAKIAASFSQTIRTQIYDKVESFSMQEINGFSTASLITRSTNDVNQIQMVIAMGLQVIIKAPVMAVWAIMKIVDKSWQWTSATAVAVAFVLIMIMIVMTFAMPKFKKMQWLTDNLNRVTRENLTGLRVIRAYNAEQFQEKKFDEANDELTGTQLFAHRVMAVINPGMNSVMSGLNLAIYWVGAALINAAAMPDKLTLFSDMVVLSSYAVQVVMSFMMLTMIFIMMPRATVSANRINEILDTESTIKDGSISDDNQSLKGEVEFKNVSFKYPDAAEYVLENISFTAKKGEVVAFIGSTGSGKSTLVNLIPRFYDATEGEILVDGINVKDYTLNALHNKLGYVSQRPVLFSGTVAENVSYGDNGHNPPTDEEIKKAVAIAQGTEFVEKMEKQYNSQISQGGTNISGGQKQRLAIARAICRKPEIYIFDDSFSALDYKTDRELRSQLAKETAGTTSLIVAQRIGTIKNADKIIVLDEGKIAGMGKHEELMKTCEVYRQIAYSQLSKEELA